MNRQIFVNEYAKAIKTDLGEEILEIVGFAYGTLRAEQKPRCN